MAGVTGLEPAASGVTGQRSNQLSYTPLWFEVAEFEQFENYFFQGNELHHRYFSDFCQEVFLSI